MRLPELHPWLDKTWQQIQASGERLPHAILISGPAGLGKTEFAYRLAASLLCQEPANDGEPCGQCKSCRLYAADSHPDFRIVQPEDDSSLIVVDQVRSIIQYTSLRAHTSARKVIVLTPAEAMNINTSNGLLKILEEPPSDSVLILVCSTPQALSATIRSRCAHFRIGQPAQSDAIEWLVRHGMSDQVAVDLLAAGNNAPLRAQELEQQGFSKARQMMIEDLKALLQPSGNPVGCAARWKAIGAGFCLAWLGGLIADLIQVSVVRPETPRLNNPSLQEVLKDMAVLTTPERLFGLLDKTVEAANLASTPLDDTLLIEDILIGWSRTRI